MSDNSGVLYVIATPIGNLQDISDRAKQVLREVDLILAEDTRHSRKLLDHLLITTPMQTYHDHNEQTVIPLVLEMLQHGSKLALISDAGTPLICDPGFHLVKTAYEQGIQVIPIPGPAAFLAALSVSGVPTDKFIFEGFLSTKSTARRKRLQELASETRTMIFYEAPHRILQILEEICDMFGGDRVVCVCRELTKKFETIYRDTCGKVLEQLAGNPMQQKGEFVIILQGSDQKDAHAASEVTRILQILLKHKISVKEVSGIVAEITGARKNEIYGLALHLSEK